MKNNIQVINQEIRFLIIKVIFLTICVVVISMVSFKLNDIAKQICNPDDINTKPYCDITK